MKRRCSVAALLAVLAAGTGTAAAAGGASIHLNAPSSVPAGTPFRVTAHGQSPSKGFVRVFFTNKSTCPATGADALKEHDVGITFGGVPAASVPKGSYSVTSDSGWPPHEGSGGTLCGMLYAKGQTINEKPRAHTSKNIEFT